MDCQYSRAIKTKESLESQSLEKKLCLFHVAVYGPYAAKMMLNAKKNSKPRDSRDSSVLFNLTYWQTVFKVSAFF